ncbi:hypothetical protein FQV39_29180 [Bosea sp. F3-2]|uniref:hypothetical protein n=1 Tax=Bosea sp. F3-2 TaxID=2599640 RepID=UPI0011EF9197|nr:hypothetical protein [Bosea sp. F3-2]QEL26224.1 hypothetical protein FQV39_29180 [Bosea sp. F3-2]
MTATTIGWLRELIETRSDIDAALRNASEELAEARRGTVHGRDCFRTFRARLCRRSKEQLKAGKSESEAIREAGLLKSAL